MTEEDNVLKKPNWVTLISDHAPTLRLVLEGLVSEWNLAYSILFAEGYELPLTEHHTNFCDTIRQHPDAARCCQQDDLNAAAEAAQQKASYLYKCHAQLWNIAVPLLVKDEVVATIICGQRRSDSVTDSVQSVKALVQLERSLHIPQGHLLPLHSAVPALSEAELQKIIVQLQKGALIIGRLLNDLYELAMKRSEANERVREMQVLPKVSSQLSKIVPIDTFWKRVNKALRDICRTIDAKYGLLLVANHAARTRYVVMSSSETKTAQFVAAEYLLAQSPLLKHALAACESVVPDLTPYVDDPIILTLLSESPTLSAAILIAFDLSETESAVMAFFREQHVSGFGLPFEQDRGLLLAIKREIVRAYENCKLFESERQMERERRRFLQDVTHQLANPLTGIAAHAENLRDGRLSEERIKNVYTDLVEQSRSVARLAKNFARVAMMDEDPGALTGTLNFSRQKLPSLLIDCARDVQGLARSHRIRVHIDTESLEALPEIAVDVDLIRQAATNLLDNAVKYADVNTQVLVHGSMDEQNVYLHFVNQGISISDADAQRIFHRYFRSDESRKRVPHGTGIGLTIVKQIVEQHGGQISVTPSEPIEQGYQTTFVVRLPKRSAA